MENDWVYIKNKKPNTNKSYVSYLMALLPIDVVSVSVLLEICYTDGTIQHSYYYMDEYCEETNKDGMFLDGHGGTHGRVEYWRYVIAPMGNFVIDRFTIWDKQEG